MGTQRGNVIRWTARILSILMIGVLLLFVIGEGDFSELIKLGKEEIVGLVFFPIGVVSGMVIGWWREGIGGFVTIGSLIGFYLIQFTVSGDLPGGPFFLIFSLPGVLFLLYWGIYKNK